MTDQSALPNTINRRRSGQLQYRMECKRCGTVRWFALDAIGALHCRLGWFVFSRPGRKVEPQISEAQP